MNKNLAVSLAVWNIVLTIAFVGLFIEIVDLRVEIESVQRISQMQHDSQHESLMRVADAVEANTESITKNAESILTISGATISNSKSIEILVAMIQDQDEWAVEAIAEIYQGHIIPIRAMLMDCKVTACP